jgi:hypothetical protein
MTEQSTAQIAGRVLLGSAPNVLLEIGERTKDLVVEGRTFRTTVDLQPGTNTVRVVATAASGHQSEDVITIEYLPPVSAARIAIKSPTDGHTLAAADLPFVVMEGDVDDARVNRVRLVINESRVVVPVVERRFRHVVPVLEPVVRLRAELVEASDASKPSPTITVNNPHPTNAAVLVVDWAAPSTDPRPQVTAMFRARSDRVDVADRPVSVESVASRPELPPDVFVIRRTQPGVYRLVLRNASTGAASGTPILYLGRSGAPTMHVLPPLALTGNGQLLLTRILQPYGISWDQDDWFSGRSESSDTITKFRVPEGITWTERKVPAR